ncbi:MAG: hypothetical protein OXI20_05415 [Rhodospirillales bacterium]|nr:hypothetical protein [Rhodospirillales bacterium]
MTLILDIIASPRLVNLQGPEDDLGSDGAWVRLTNAGDDTLYWSMEDPPPEEGVPGFPLGRGRSHTITLGGASGTENELSLFAWSVGNSRLIAAPVGLASERGQVPGPTGRIVLTPTVINIPAPAGLRAGGNFVIMNAGGGTAYLFEGRSLPSPRIASERLETGQHFKGVETDDGRMIFAWTDKYAGATLLICAADARWEL